MVSRKKKKSVGNKHTTRPPRTIAALRVFLGIVFICAAAYRTFHYDAAVREMNVLALPTILIIPIILLELGIGAALIAGWRTRQVTILTALFLIFAVSTGIIIGGQNIIASAGELFIFNPTPTDIFLHGTYLVIALAIAVQYRKS